MPHATFPEPTRRDPCHHRNPATLIPRLSKVTVCPSCTIQDSIFVIKKIQAELNARGGIFVSRPRTKRDLHDIQWAAHLELRNRWRKEKISLLNNIMMFEELAKSSERSEGWEVLDRALEEFQQEAEILAEVPGYPQEMSEEEVGDIVKRMMEQLKNTLSGIIDEEDLAEDEDMGACPFPDSDVDTDSEDENMVDADQATDAQSERDDNEEDQLNPEFDAEDVMDVEVAPSSDPTTPTNGTKTPGKHVRFTEFATICPDSLTFVPSLFPHNPFGFPDPSQIALPLNPHLQPTSNALSTSSKLQQHRGRANARHKRQKSRFKRSSSGYRWGRWGSPAGYEHPDTSCFRLSWEDAEIYWREMDREAKREKKVHDGLKRIAGRWVLTRVLTTALWSYEKSMQEMLRRAAA